MAVKTLYGVSILTLGSSLVALGWGHLAPDAGEVVRAHLVLGTQLLEEGRLEPASQELRLALPAREAPVRLAAHHNLGLAFLRQALEEDGPQARVWAGEAIRHEEDALAIRPGLRGAAWNLELALRRLRELEDEARGGGEAEADRLLSSFRLQEEEKVGGRVRDLLGEMERGVAPPSGKGPPW